ncbi:hypothetical protein NC653_023018 [Populus alba x Populus x berolinensis]|uniref:Uncharacterized protein n=1 Tax=Populus alba x Populus x berolinensis TaxID=444605 RepID=A0AAD6MGH0_9ROSI|nr:hypothetical protein NC653_023013 [Populus alba x Populus x berolinensis]KAJ6984901.1 hypothetical protein NC653_023018 [Populus alba x Populus x berolinensis]
MVVSIYISGLLLEAVRIGSNPKGCLKIERTVHEPLSEVSAWNKECANNLLLEQGMLQLRVGTRAQQKRYMMEYYDQPILTRIGHKLGRTIRNDDSAASSTGAKFARISEEIDLNKPLYSKFRMKRKIWKAEKYGHRKESCSDIQEGNNLDSMDENSPLSVPVADPTPVIRPEIGEPFGSWMLCKGTENEGGNPCLRISSSRNGNPTPQGKSVCFESVNEGASISNVRPQGYLVVNGPRNALPRPKPRGVMATHESHKLKDHQTTRHFLLVSLLISLLNRPDDFVKATQEGQFCEGVVSEEIASMLGIGDSQLLVVGVIEAVSARLIYCGFYIGTAASSSFHSILMELLRMNRVDIVILAEPIIITINNGGKQQDQGSNNTMVDGVAAEISFNDAGTEETV